LTKQKGAVVDAGKVGEATVLELGTKGLLKGLVHKGDAGVLLEDQGVGDSDGFIVGTPARGSDPSADKDHCRVIDHEGIAGIVLAGHVNAGNELKRACGVPSLAECPVVL
jgi:hypothetical protein